MSLKQKLDGLVKRDRSGYGENAMAREFGGVFIPAGPEVNRSKGCCACVTFTPDIVEEEERVTQGKFRHMTPHSQFVELELVTDEMTESIPVYTRTADSMAVRMAKLFAMNPLAVWTVVNKALADDRTTILMVIPQAIDRLGGDTREKVVRQVKALPKEPRLRDLHAAVA